MEHHELKKQPSESVESKKRRRRIWKMFGVGLAFFLITAVWLLMHRPPNPVTAPPKDVVRYIASPAFTALPEKDKEDYLSRFQSHTGTDFRKYMNDRSLSQGQRMTLRRNGMALRRAEMQARIKKYLAADEAGRNQIINDMVAEMAARRQQAPAGGRTGAGGGPGRGGGPGGGGARMQSMLENSSSTERAVMHEIHERMRAAMQHK